MVHWERNLFYQRIATSIFKNPARLFVLGFGILILIGSILLSLPVATQSGEGLPYIDALFTSTSAVAVTGLVVVDTGTTFSLFGQIVIMLLIQVGGLGFMTMATLFSLILGRKITFRERVMIQESLNHATLEGIVKMVQRVLLYTFVIEGTGAILLFLYWLPSMGWERALLFGIFHSISSFNNAGLHRPHPIQRARSLASRFFSFSGICSLCLLIRSPCSWTAL